MASILNLPWGMALVLTVSMQIPCAAQTGPRDLTDISLEDLMNIQVTSVSKKEQKLSMTGAAIFVITQEDIHRSGATNIPDLLRTAPGVNVAQINANSWAISVRGFNGPFADKVLVLIDDRSVFSPDTSAGSGISRMCRSKISSGSRSSAAPVVRFGAPMR